MNSRVKYSLIAVPLLAVAVFFMTSLEMSLHQVSAQRQTVPLVTLQSSERILENVPYGSALASADGKQIYVLRRDTDSISLYDSEHKRAKDLRGLDLTARLLGLSAQGHMYVATKSEIREIDGDGRAVRAFRIHDPISLAVLSDGNVAVASPDSEKLLDIYDGAGNRSRSVGKPKQFDVRNPAQNAFLNSGKAVAGLSGTFYYVSTFALTPTVQKFSSNGDLLSEFVVEGSAIELQLERAKVPSGITDSQKVGGIQIINTAAVDPATGHLWLGMNGLSARDRTIPESGVLYEYDSEGVKLAEYALWRNESAPESGFITDVRDITVHAPWIHVLTSRGTVYRFNINDRLAGDARGSKEPKSASTGLLAWFTKGFRSSFSPRTSTLDPDVCPAEQTAYTCTANCANSTTVDCKADAVAHKLGTEIIFDSSCTANETGCDTTVHLCNTANGHIGDYTTNLHCPSPTPTPTPPPESMNPGCSEEQWGFWNSRFDCQWAYSGCECYDSNNTPILVDVLGNGFNLTNAASGVNFDLDNHARADRFSWTAAGSDDAFLALDRNGNGTIDNGSELFGSAANQSSFAGVPRNGFLALDEFDKTANGGNGDGIIDSRDAVFANLRLWQDTNHNGVSEANELHTLTQLGVDSISLDYKESKRTDEYGNQFRYRAKVDDAKHKHVGRWAWDVILQKGN